ncbi:barstar family protein [Sphingobium sp. D43FB]|uniref:barstar family protein n=1 Tax=Sphingobium sp. D43FB TaxID=2017595 RepID=UPI000BB5465E|nr:barstar family protein [Sphingobium sp. D43FB]PBN44307.1 hypothetical protein SxD43FB_05840 [Sphingobium sp. D43FB]
MNVVELNAQRWETRDDFYDALLSKLGAPDWHGRSIAALIDSMIVGDINEVKLPTRVIVTGLDRAGGTAFDEMVSAFAALARYGALFQVISGQASLEIVEKV